VAQAVAAGASALRVFFAPVSVFRDRHCVILQRGEPLPLAMAHLALMRKRVLAGYHLRQQAGLTPA